ncbi:MAG: hypothetical protein NC084_12530 [Bacteroides sp.]|nr:hypothetical protein [Eubacterium sp.]MCM1417721.1 hypothetical protein [Roseburia sp.]MCM1463519.1 hypothetical protein [Bacteroides sp.]
MDIEVVKLILQILSMIGVGTIISGVISRKMTVYENQKTDDEQRKQKESEDSQNLIRYLSDANRLMLRNAIYELCGKVKKRGYIYLYEAENLREILETYEKLGGNGTAHATATHTLEDYEVITAEEEID